MARKSRKAQVQSTPVAEIKKETSALSTAIYARLSVENSGKDDDGNSLQNQIDVCKDYLDGCPYLQLVEVYSDNGRTGTVFDRPAWNRLMEDVRSGKIQCIVVRELHGNPVGELAELGERHLFQGHLQKGLHGAPGADGNGDLSEPKPPLRLPLERG